MKKLIVALLFFPTLLLSQVVNVESKRQSEENGWNGQINIGFDLSQSTVMEWEFDNTTFLQWDNENWSVLILNETNIDKGEEISFVNDGYQHLRLSRKLNNTYTLEGFAQSQYDELRDIKNRQLYGVGIRHATESLDFFGLSGFYEYEKQAINEEQSKELVETNIRLSAYTQLNFDILKHISIRTTSYIQPSVLDISDFRITNQTSLFLNITDQVFFSCSFEGSYDSNPVLTIPKFTYNIENGFGFEF